VLLVSPAVTAAAPILFTDREAFLAATNPDRLLTFDEPTFGVSELVFTPSGGPFPQTRFDFGDVQVVYLNQDPIGLGAPFPSLDDVVPITPSSVTIRLPANTYAVGVDLLQAANTGFTIGAGGVQWSNPWRPSIECPLIPGGTPPCEAFTGFVGFVAADHNESIQSLTALATPIGFLTQPPQALGYPAVLDNLTIQVPEPATALLLGAGLVGVYWRGRRAK
jgi:hypothetical protein